MPETDAPIPRRRPPGDWVYVGEQNLKHQSVEGHALGPCFGKISLFRVGWKIKRQRHGSPFRPSPASSILPQSGYSKSPDERAADRSLPSYCSRPALSILANIRYAPGTPAGNSRNHEYALKIYTPFP